MLKPYVFFAWMIVQSCHLPISLFFLWSDALCLVFNLFFLTWATAFTTLVTVAKAVFFFLLSRCHSQENALDKCAISFFFLFFFSSHGAFCCNYNASLLQKIQLLFSQWSTWRCLLIWRNPHCRRASLCLSPKNHSDSLLWLKTE